MEFHLAGGSAGRVHIDVILRRIGIIYLITIDWVGIDRGKAGLVFFAGTGNFIPVFIKANDCYVSRHHNGGRCNGCHFCGREIQPQGRRQHTGAIIGVYIHPCSTQVTGFLPEQLRELQPVAEVLTGGQCETRILAIGSADIQACVVYYGTLRNKQPVAIVITIFTDCNGLRLFLAPLKGKQYIRQGFRSQRGREPAEGQQCSQK